MRLSKLYAIKKETEIVNSQAKPQVAFGFQSAASDKFRFIPNDELTKQAREASEISIRIENKLRKDGTPYQVNRAVLKVGDGVYVFNVYHAQKGYAHISRERVISKEELMKLRFGYCMRGDDYITKVRLIGGIPRNCAIGYLEYE